MKDFHGIYRSAFARGKNAANKIKRIRNRRAFRSSLRPNDTFLVSYPRSGTTWMRILVGHCLELLDDTDSAMLSEKSQLRVPTLNHLTSKIRRGELVSLPPELQNHNSTEPRFFSMHNPHDPIFPRVVYTVRDPRAVTVSYYHYCRYVGSIDLNLSLEEFVDQDIHHHNIPWDVHVEQWLEHPDSSLLLVKYEDMIDDAVGQLSRIMSFAGMNIDQEKINFAARAADFKKIRAERERKSIFHPNGDRNESFYRKGKKDSWREELPAESHELLLSRFGETMKKMGYLE